MKLICPKCKSEDIETEKRPNGSSICRSCGHTETTWDWEQKQRATEFIASERCYSS